MQPAGMEPSENGDLSNVTGEGCLPADINVFLQTEAGFGDFTVVCQETQVP